jgi:lycopene beta-cyclase
MMFRAAEPSERYRILERFYRLPEPLISRFYEGSLTWRDRVRILTGRPPVPVGRALKCLFERGAAVGTATRHRGATP